MPPADLAARARSTACSPCSTSVFNEGYQASGGAELSRRPLTQEAIRLAGLVVDLLPDEPEVQGLLALMELHDARRAARVDPLGDIVPLDVQDRARWDRARIDVPWPAARHRTGGRRRPGSYQLQAAIAACHATAVDAASTDWAEIAALYGRLLRFSDRTITQACTLLLRESGQPLHVNELYNLLVAGGMKFKGNNPTISIAVSLNRNRRFRKVDPGTFDLVIREAIQAAS